MWQQQGRSQSDTRNVRRTHKHGQGCKDGNRDCRGMASASHLHAAVRNYMLTWIAADKAAHFLQTTDQPPSVPWAQGPLRLPIIIILSAKKAHFSQEVGQAQKTCCICSLAAIAVLHFIAFCRLHSLTQHTHTVSPILSLNMPQLPCHLESTLQAFFQLGPPGPLQLVFITGGQRLFKVDLIGVPSSLPIYVSMARRDNGLSQEQVDMRR